MTKTISEIMLPTTHQVWQELDELIRLSSIAELIAGEVTSTMESLNGAEVDVGDGLKIIANSPHCLPRAERDKIICLTSLLESIAYRIRVDFGIWPTPGFVEVFSKEWKGIEQVDQALKELKEGV